MISGNDANIAPVELKGVTQRFGRKTPFSDASKVILDDISLTLDQGQILCLLGPSGCGKTTLVDLIMGIRVPVAGEVWVLGEKAPYPYARERIGYMPQDDALYGDITAEENLRFFGVMYGLSGQALRDRIDEMLEFGRLVEHRNKLVSAFSGGMKRRLSLGIALMHNPNVLILDEPTVGLDPDHRRHIWDKFEQLAAEGKTILVTTHVMDEAARCGQIAMLHRGHIIAQASPNEVLAQTGACDLEEAFLILEQNAHSKEVCHA